MPKIDFSRPMNPLELQAKCDTVLDEVIRTGRSVTITRLGKPIVDIRPYQQSGRPDTPRPSRRQQIRDSR